MWNWKTTTVAAGAAVVVLAATPSVVAATSGDTEQLTATSGELQHHRQQRPVVEMPDARLKFEINATDGDGGIQLFADADAWKRLSLFDPHGRRIFTSVTRGRMAQQGGTELFLESAEPTFDEVSLEELLERWPEGIYRFRGRGLDGERYVGSAELTHDLPDGPVLVAPIEGDPLQDPDATVVSWEPVAAPNSSPIIGYQVLVVRPDTGLDGLPTIELDVMMPPTATSMAVPPGFLKAGTEYEWEVLAIEAGGNQTLSASTFTTAE